MECSFASYLKTFYHSCIIDKRLDFVLVLPVGAADVVAFAVCVDCGEVAIQR